jgi:hypothetical protein
LFRLLQLGLGKPTTMDAAIFRFRASRFGYLAVTAFVLQKKKSKRHERAASGHSISQNI